MALKSKSAAVNADTEVIRIEADDFGNFMQVEEFIKLHDPIDQIVTVSSNHSESFWVYTLETKTGRYLANNLEVGNCRCYAEPLINDLLEYTEGD